MDNLSQTLIKLFQCIIMLMKDISLISNVNMSLNLQTFDLAEPLLNWKAFY